MLRGTRFARGDTNKLYTHPDENPIIRELKILMVARDYKCNNVHISHI